MKYNFKRTGHGVTDNLGKQLQKVVRIMNQNKFATRYRYVSSAERFVKYLAREFRLKKFANFQDKHLEKYVIYLKSKELSDKYIKNELSGIRFIHNSMDNTKYELADPTVFNKSVGLSSTGDNRSDKAWSENELEAFKSMATKMGDQNLSDVFEGIRATGTRIDEICTLRYQDGRAALKNDYLLLTNTKGGKERKVQLNDRSRIILAEKVLMKKPGDYLFVPGEYVKAKEVHKYKKKVQNFIYNHRDKIQDKDRTLSGHNVNNDDRGALTPHGLRHSFAREEYLKRRAMGVPKGKARFEVAQMLGHGRDSVTFIYLGTVEE